MKLSVRFTIIMALVAATASVSRACPFCSAVSLTFSEEMKQADAAVIARLVERGELPKDPTAEVVPGASDSTFEIVDVLKGDKALGKSPRFMAVYFGKEPIGTRFLVIGAEPPVLKWSAPIKLSDRGIEYVKKSSKLPAKGVERLVFFQKYIARFLQ